MDPFKVILSFALKFLAVYIGALLFLTLTGTDQLMRDAYGNIGEKLYQNWSDEVEIHVKTLDVEEEENDLLFQIVDKKRLEEVRKEMRETGKSDKQIKTLAFKTNSKTTFLMPLIFFLALVVAYPSGFKHKLLSFLIGVLPLLLYIFFKLGCMLFYTIDESEEFFPSYVLSSFSNNILYVIDSLFIEAAYIVGVVVWIMVCVRKQDFKGLLE